MILERYFLLIDILDGQFHTQHACNAIDEGPCGIYNKLGRDGAGRISVRNTQTITGISFNRRYITLNFFASSRSNSFQHVLPELLTAQVAAATNMDDVLYLRRERRKLLLNLLLVVIDINVDIPWNIGSKIRNIVPTGREHIATTRHVKDIVRFTSEPV